MNVKILAGLFSIGILSSCNDAIPESQGVSHIEYFGFAIIDTYWDDPSDSEIKTNYADEIHSFANVADILVVNPSDDIVQRVALFSRYGMRAIIHTHELLFHRTDSNAPSGVHYRLRPNYKERWSQFKNANASILNNAYIAALYIGEEPTWNGISYTELSSVANLLKTDKPDIPLMVIEAYPSLKDVQIPQDVDWFGFDRYYIENPNDDPNFLNDWQLLKSKISPGQRIVVIMDSHYIAGMHSTEIERMGVVANNYYQLAKTDPRVIGLLGYCWPNGFGNQKAIGARGMPADVQSEYERIGKEIVKK